MLELVTSANMKQELVVILEISKLLEAPLDPQKMIHGILRLLSQMRGLNCGRVLVPNEKNNILDVRYSYGLSFQRLQQGRYSVAMNEGVTGYVMRTGSIGLVPDVDKEPMFIKRIAQRDIEDEHSHLSFIAVPILENGKPIGVLSVQRAGTTDRPFDNDICLLRIVSAAIGQVMRIHKFVREETEHLFRENQTLKNNIAQEEMLNKILSHGIIGTSATLMDAVRHSIQVARSDAPVMLLGESGTGKEKFARMIHQQSDRGERPFICINCAAIPKELLESELFGYEKGSFTGATSAKKGKIALADGGTLFLDEIGDMPFELQSKLLRVLQEKSVDPIGSTHSTSVNFRILTATHVNLQELVNSGRFRLDLFYRLNVVPIYLPPIRERTGDVKQLALHFLNELNHQYERNIVLDADALQMLDRYSWPGNIRQLQNVLERAVLMAETAFIKSPDIRRILNDEGAVHLPNQNRQTQAVHTASHAADKHSNSTTNHQPSNAEMRRYAWVQNDEVQSIVTALNHANGNKTQAARLLNMSLRQLRYRISKLGIEPNSSHSAL